MPIGRKPSKDLLHHSIPTSSPPSPDALHAAVALPALRSGSLAPRRSLESPAPPLLGWSDVLDSDQKSVLCPAPVASHCSPPPAPCLRPCAQH
jgi:hypothetical protein